MDDNTQEKPRKKRHRRPPFLLILILLIAVAAIALYLGRGMGLGQGSGTADGGASSSPSAAVSDTPAPDHSQEPEDGGLDVTVEVTRSQYLVDGKEMSLADLEAMLQEADLAHSTVTVKDNYGSAKAHEELTALLARYGVSAVTE